MKSKRNLAEELTETWINFRYKDPHEICQKAVKVTKECDRVVRLYEWAKELVENLKKETEELKNPQK